jgi:hypothetical protein
VGGLKDTKPRRVGQRGRQPDEGGGDCNQRFRIDLMGVRGSQTARLRPDDVLRVALRSEGRIQAVVCQTENQEVVGALSAFPGLADLIACLERGFAYDAVVLRANTVGCTVYVSRSHR